MDVRHNAEITCPESLKIRDICADSQMSRSTIYKEIRKGRLTARKIGKSTRVLRKDYMAFLNALPVLRTTVPPSSTSNAKKPLRQQATAQTLRARPRQGSSSSVQMGVAPK